MSLLTSPSLIPHTVKAQGLFSSQSAFRKPTFNNNISKISNNFNKFASFIHPKDLAIKQAQPVRILAKNEDPELILSEPTKKVKPSKDKPVILSQPSHNKTQQNIVESSKLTIDEVFNTPLESKQLNNGSFFDECFDEGSSLSFISSHPSIENLDEEIANAKSSNNHVSTLTNKQQMQADVQSLVVKDNGMQRLNYLYQDNMLLNRQNHSMFNPFDQESVFKPFELLRILPVNFPDTKDLICNVPLSIPPNNLSQYIQFNMHNQQLLQHSLNLSDKSINEFVKNTLDSRAPEDGYDSDSYATRSTRSGEKSQKGASPLYNGNEYLYEEESKLEQQIKKQKANKVRKQAKRNNVNKEKKGRPLNLKLDVNPKQLKVERRLNRLQLLRYQQEDMEEDEEIKKFGISELLSRANSTVQENKDSQFEASEAKLNENDTQMHEDMIKYSQAVVPQLGETSARGQRVALKSVWNPEHIQEEMLENYFQQLAEVLESQVTDQEAALKLLTTFGMDILLTLETVRGNKELYSEMFRVKVKRLRRRGA